MDLIEQTYEELSNYSHSIFIVNRWVELQNSKGPMQTRTRVDITRIHQLPILNGRDKKAKLVAAARVFYEHYVELHGVDSVIWYAGEQLVNGPPISVFIPGDSNGVINLSINLSVHVRCFNAVLDIGGDHEYRH